MFVQNIRYVYFLFIIIIGLLIKGECSNLCTTLNGERGECVPIFRCGLFLNALVSGDSELLSFVRKSRCDSNNWQYVCCGTLAGYKRTSAPIERNQKNLLLNGELCGYEDQYKIIGGGQSAFEELTWMALLEYEKNSVRRFACGGVLISSQYVLTSAHCVKEKTAEFGQLIHVRLGEWNLQTNPDCIPYKGYVDCNDPPLDVHVSEIIVHSNYNGRKNDVALLRLDRSINFEEKQTRPICLPTNQTLVGKLHVTGWASGSPIRQRGTVAIVSNAKCNPRQWQVCAGGVAINDSCIEEIGGPLMQQTEYGSWVVVGVATSEPACGYITMARTYTNVSHYYNWISNYVKP